MAVKGKEEEEEFYTQNWIANARVPSRPIFVPNFRIDKRKKYAVTRIG